MEDYSIMTVKEVAARWRCSTAAIYELIRRKKLLAIRIGVKGFRIFTQDVKDYEDRLRHAS